MAVLSHNCWQFAVLNFARARLGAVLVPVNFMLGGDEIAFILDHSGAAAFVVEDALVPVAREGARRRRGRRRRPWLVGLPRRPRPRRLGGLDALDGSTRRDRRRTCAVADDDPVRLMYTTGTESRPKGAMLSSRVADRAVRLAASSTAG